MSANTLKNEEAMAYDEVPYESYAYPQTHPYHLYTVATLFKMNPAPFEKAKVLELGCAGGFNLAPLAIAFPKADFFGIDISKEQIDSALKMKEELGLDNLNFAKQNILEFSPKSKKDKYDYIICHGIYSWVPEDVRKAILNICNDYLTDNGIAIVSYNALPGWNAVRSLREMMLYHTKRFNTPVEKLAQASHLLSFLSDNVPQNNVAYKSMIENEMKLLNSANATYLYHDHLESENAQFYLTDFVNSARACGLEYVGDTNVNSMYIGNMPKDAMEKLKVINDIVAQEQYMDFINNRRFRSTVLCKRGNKIDRNLSKEQIMDYYINFYQIPTVTKDVASGKTSFKIGGIGLETTDTILSSLLVELAESKQLSVSAKDLLKIVQKKLGLKDKKDVEHVLLENGLNLALRGILSLSSYSPNYVTDISEKPEAYKLARYEAKLNNYTRKKLTNMFSASINTDIVTNILISEMDGTKTISELIDIMYQKNKEGLLRIDKDGKPLEDKDAVKAVITQLIEKLLPKLAEKHFLVA